MLCWSIIVSYYGKVQIKIGVLLTDYAVQVCLVRVVLCNDALSMNSFNKATRDRMESLLSLGAQVLFR